MSGIYAVVAEASSVAGVADALYLGGRGGPAVPGSPVGVAGRTGEMAHIRHAPGVALFGAAQPCAQDLCVRREAFLAALAVSTRVGSSTDAATVPAELWLSEGVAARAGALVVLLAASKAVAGLFLHRADDFCPLSVLGGALQLVAPVVSRDRSQCEVKVESQ